MCVGCANETQRHSRCGCLTHCGGGGVLPAGQPSCGGFLLCEGSCVLIPERDMLFPTSLHVFLACAVGRDLTAADERATGACSTRLSCCMSIIRATVQCLSEFERLMPTALSALNGHQKMTPEPLIQCSCKAIVTHFYVQGQSQLVSGTTCKHQT